MSEQRWYATRSRKQFHHPIPVDAVALGQVFTPIPHATARADRRAALSGLRGRACQPAVQTFQGAGTVLQPHLRARSARPRPRSGRTGRGIVPPPPLQLIPPHRVARRPVPPWPRLRGRTLHVGGHAHGVIPEGPCTVKATAIHVPGAVAGQVYAFGTPSSRVPGGAAAQDLFVPGIAAGDVC